MRSFALYALSYAAALLVLLSLAALSGFLLAKGLPSLNPGLLFGGVPALDAIFARVPVWNGIWPAVAGSLLLLFVTMAIVTAPGIACGVYLACFASGRERAVIGECVGVLAGIPSIVMGLFGLEAVILLRRTFLPNATTCLLLAACCLAILTLPALVAATRSAIEALPAELSLTAASLGMSRSQIVRRLLIPAAGPGILGGVILAMGRAMEDTAVIMLTGAVANAGLPAGLTGKFEALPFRIYYAAAQYSGPEELSRGFGTALLLLLLSEALIVAAKTLQRRMTRRWKGA